MMKKRIRLNKCSIFALLNVLPFIASCGNHCDHTVLHLDEINIETNNHERLGIFCCDCKQNKIERTIQPKDLNLPIVNFIGSLEGITKENKKKISVEFISPNESSSFVTDATVKLQGAVTVSHPKKNYTIDLYEPQSDFTKKNEIQICNEWEPSAKYTLKANYLDETAARNVVMAKLYGQIIHLQKTDLPIDDLVNGGAVDGFPVVLYLNNSFLGLYTFNLPKTKNLLGMKKYTSEHKGLLFANDSNNFTQLCKTIEIENLEKEGWEIEYCSTGEDEYSQYSWMIDSFNNLINFLINTTTEGEIKLHLNDYVIFDRVLDYLIYIDFCNLWDNIDRNIIWVTYDGTHWFPSAYDLENCFGNNYGQIRIKYDSNIPSTTNLLFRRIKDYYMPQYKSRYHELRQSVLSTDNIINLFKSFVSQIPLVLYQANTKKWSEKEMDLEIREIAEYITKRGDYFDDKMK